MFGRQVEVPREAGNPSCGGRSGWCLAMRLRAAVDFSLTLEGLKVKKVTSFVETVLDWPARRAARRNGTVGLHCGEQKEGTIDVARASYQPPISKKQQRNRQA